MAFPKFHGISLAQNGFIENLRVERLAADPVPAQAGRIWFNTTERKFKHSTLDELGAVIIRSFATEEELVASIQAVSDRVTAVEGSYVKKDGSVAFTGDVDAGSNKVVNVAAPVADTDAANKGYVDAGIAVVEQQVAALGAAFNYVSTLAGGVDEASAFDMETLEAGTKDAGDYYKVSTAGWFKVGAEGVPFYAKIKDGLLWNTAGAVDVIDNTNSEVQGTAGEIAVTGSTDTGFTVAVDEAFKTRVSDLEDETTSLQSELDATQAGAGLGADGTYQARTGSNYLDAATSLADEGTKLDAALKAESDRAKAAEGDLTTLSTTDKTSLVAAINEVDAELADVVANSGMVGEIDEQQVVGFVHPLAVSSMIEGAELSGSGGVILAAGDKLINKSSGDIYTVQAGGAALQMTGELVPGQIRLVQVQYPLGLFASGTYLYHKNPETGSVVSSILGSNALSSHYWFDNGERKYGNQSFAELFTNQGDLTALTTADKSSLVAAINEVDAAAGEGTAALKQSINAQRFTFTSGAPALQHAVPHNLNSGLVSVDVWTKGDDGLYRNDIVAVTLTDANTATVDLTEARDVKVVVQALDNLA